MSAALFNVNIDNSSAHGSSVATRFSRGNFLLRFRLCIFFVYNNNMVGWFCDSSVFSCPQLGFFFECGGKLEKNYTTIATNQISFLSRNIWIIKFYRMLYTLEFLVRKSVEVGSIDPVVVRRDKWITWDTCLLWCPSRGKSWMPFDAQNQGVDPIKRTRRNLSHLCTCIATDGQLSKDRQNLITATLYPLREKGKMYRQYLHFYTIFVV